MIIYEWPSSGGVMREIPESLELFGKSRVMVT